MGRQLFGMDALLERFRAWETRARGWDVYPHPIEIEPPFESFHAGAQRLLADDGQRHTLLSRWIARAPPAPQVVIGAPEPREPNPAPEGVDLVELQLLLPRDAEVDLDAVRHVLLSLTHLSDPIAFEFGGTAERLRAQFVCPQGAGAALEQQLSAQIERVVVRPRQGWLEDTMQTGSHRCVVEFGLDSLFFLPLRTADSLDIDPLSAVAAALSTLQRGESGILQVIFREADLKWAEEARYLTDILLSEETDALTLVGEKLESRLFATVLRVAASAASHDRARAIAQSIGAAFGFSTRPGANALVPLSNDEYPDEEHVADAISRRSRRSGMLLSLDELVSFVHPPSASVRTERLERDIKKTRPAPASCIGTEFVLGRNTHAGKSVTVSLKTTERLRHTYVIGASGTGKSTVLLNMILQDVDAGGGCALLDPHGDLVEQVLERIPEERLEDVVLLDASDEQYPVGFNILQAHSDSEKNLLASDLVEAFKRLSTTWGDQMTSVLGNAILAVLESSRRGTLADLRRFLVEQDFRDQYLESVKDPEIIYYWRKEFPLLTGRPQAPLLTRLDTFLRPKLIRAMVSQKHDRLDFRWMMDSKKIFLGKLTQGAIGEENSYLLGTLLVTKMHQAALGRQNVPEGERTPFFLYLDEFHNFVTPSMASILSGARKFGLGLVLSHQELRQIRSQDENVASAMIANPYTRICFRLGDDDAKRLQPGFANFDAKDLQSLGVGEAIMRLERAEYDFTLSTPHLPPKPPNAEDRRVSIVESSRRRFARKREEVIAETQAAEPIAPKSKLRAPRNFGAPKKP